jgi:FO synthase subunit 1
MVPNSPGPITYSPAITLVPTYECFNRCQYCNFRTDPGQDTWLSLEAARQQLQQARAHGAIEALILSGEVHPASSRRARWLQHLYDLAALALDMGLLPHTNAGPLSQTEMAQLQTVNVSMGLMVEQVTPHLMAGVHRHAPSKEPQLRLQQLAQAGQLKIPFTTGILLGIGETTAERRETLRAIARSHQRWGHIQEVILQPHQPGQHQAQAFPAYSSQALLAVIAEARQLLPADIVIQVPPNLIDQEAALVQALTCGARDLGGLGPIDEVNPDYPHPSAARLREQLKNLGWELHPRLPIYPRYDAWLSPSLRLQVDHWRSQLAPVEAPRPATA